MAGSSARLTILNGPMVGKELVLEEVVDNILIGSDGACRFHLPMPGISPIHARIWMDASGVTVYDTHSPRGLYVNDDRVNGQAPLRNGDVLWLGTPGEEEAVMIQVRLPPRGSAAAAAPVAESTEADQTVAMVPPEPVSEPEALEVVDEGATVSMPAPGLDAFMIAEPAPETLEAPPEFESDATIVDYSTPSPAPAEETLLQEESALPAPTEEPVKFAIDLPPAPPEPPPFEDETTEMAPPEPAYAPPPPPPPVVEPPPPPPRPPAPVVAPPPPVVTPPAPPRPARPAAGAAHAAPAPRPAAGSNAGKLAAAGVVGLVVVAGGGYAAWRMLQAPAAPTAPLPAPAPTAAAAATPAPIEVAPVTEPPHEVAPAPVEPVPEPPVEEAVTIVKTPPPTTAAAVGTKPVSATPTAKATAAPPPTTVSPAVVQAQQAAAQAAGHVSRGDALATGRDYAGAVAAYDEALKLEPANAKAAEGKALALAAAAALKKSFVAGRTSVQSGKAAKGGLSGFDSEDVSVAKAPDYSGRIDFEASPRNVKAGDSYTILAYLTNDGKKGFKIQGITVNTVANGARNAVPVSPRDRDLEPQQRVLLAELPGTWQADTKTWSVEVSVTSNRNDTFKNSLTWK